jgi:hypothetical protein
MQKIDLRVICVHQRELGYRYINTKEGASDTEQPNQLRGPKVFGHLARSVTVF